MPTPALEPTIHRAATIGPGAQIGTGLDLFGTRWRSHQTDIQTMSVTLDAGELTPDARELLRQSLMSLRTVDE